MLNPRHSNRQLRSPAPTRQADPNIIAGQILRVELKEDLTAGDSADAYILKWNGSDYAISSSVIEIFDPFEKYSGSARDPQTDPVTDGDRFYVAYFADVRRFEIIAPSEGSTTAKTLFLAEQTPLNYVLPQDLNADCIGYEWTPHATNLTNIDWTTEYEIVDYFGSMGLAGQKLLCEYNATLAKWIPIPYGQNAMQLARTYKPIQAGSSVDGSDIWFLAGVPFVEIVEASSLVNDQIRFDHAHSNTDINGTDADPIDIILQLFHVDGGCEFRVIGRACNP